MSQIHNSNVEMTESYQIQSNELSLNKFPCSLLRVPKKNLYMLCNSKKTQNQSYSLHDETLNQSQDTIELFKNISISIYIAQTPGTTLTCLTPVKT